MFNVIPHTEHAARHDSTRGSAESISSDSAEIASKDYRTTTSSTLLSSMTPEDEWLAFHSEETLRDTYGNEFKLPNYTIKDLRDAIPQHCYERSALRGLGYVAKDLFYLGTTFFLFNKFCTPEIIPSDLARYILWGLYTFLQGLFGLGLWVMAHECGHQAFSSSKTLNDTVGWTLHSLLLVPYFSWKISHNKHHKATANLEREMVFCPRTREEHASALGCAIHEMHELMEETPVYTAVQLLVQQLLGWPLYLFVNATGHNNHEKQSEGKGVGKKNWSGRVNHYLPSSPLFDHKDEYLVLLSDLGLSIVGAGLYMLGQRYGWTKIIIWYFIPFLWVNHWLVTITYLQHTDPSIPHYSGKTWTFVRGAAATIDREFGFVGRHFMHSIIETHVLHHHVSIIPFYHAHEATEAIKPIMGDHYRYDVEGGSIGFVKAIWKVARWCQWVEPHEHSTGENANILFFRNRNGLGLPPMKMKAQKSTM